MNTFQEEIYKLVNNNCFRKISDISYKEGKYIFIKDKKYINLSSNDYLGLSTNKELITDFIETNKTDKEFLFSSASARLLTGTSSIYSKLELNIAKLFNKEASLIFNTGYQCNMGIISSIADKNDVIFSDKLNHASIITGIKLSQADFYRYKHLDYNHLEKLLQKYRGQYKKAFIISESVFSMDGDIADIKKLIEFKNKYNCFVMIDEAHAFGIFGGSLCGICEEKNVLKDIDILTGTFGKAFASVGAFCVANRTFVDYFINKASSFIFSTALAPINIMWTNWLIENNFEIIKSQRSKLAVLYTKVHKYMQDKGQSHIIPIVIGNNKKTEATAKALCEAGYFVLPIRPPTVPANTSRLRISLTSNIAFDEMKNLFEIINKEMHK